MGMDFLSALNISAHLTAQKMRMDVIAQNIANANATRTQNGTPYRRKMVVLNSIESRGSFRDTLNKAMGQRTGGRRTG